MSTGGLPAAVETPATPATEPAGANAIEAAFGASVAAPVETTPVAVAPASVETPAADAVKHPSEIPSLLESFSKDEKPAETKPAETKPAEAKPEEAKAETKPAEVVAPAEPVPEAPIEYKFEMPPELKVAPKELTEFTETLGGIRAPAEVGQKLLDMHTRAMKQFADNFATQSYQNQVKAFNEVRQGWRTDAMADRDIGGSGHQTAMRAIAGARDRLISNEAPGTPQYTADAKAFDDFLRITGAGDHPAFLKLLHRASRFIQEPSPPTATALPTKTNGRPPTSNSLYKTPATAS